MSLLRLDQLVCRFGHTTAVDGVDLTVEPGEIVGLLGANGSGKTTTIRMGLGLQRPTAGSVELLGEPPSRRTRHRLGYVPQGLGLWQDLSVRQNLAFVARAYGVTPPALPDDLLAAADEPVASLPLGARRRVAFAAALGHQPALLVLDEPTSGVGPLERTRLWDAIHATREEAGTGVLVTTHHMSEAEQCDRVVVLLGGRVVASGTMASLLAGRSTVVVATEDWAQAFARLDRHFHAVALQGRTVRVPDADEAAVRDALAALTADVTTVPASFDEVFVTLGHAA